METEGLERFDPSPETGLDSRQVQARRDAGLVNVSVKASGKSVGEIIKGNIFTYFNLIFAVLAALLILVGSFKSLTFLPVVLANLVIGIVQELRAKKVLDKLVVLSDPRAVAVRSGEIIELRADDLVLDDIAIFRQGMQICADAVVKSGEIYVNESLLTGESVEIRKTAGDTLMSGSFVVSGECRARLEKVGADSYVSQLTIKAKEVKNQEQSEMIRVLNRLVGAVGIIIIPVGALLFLQQYFYAHAGLRDSVVSMVAAVIGMIPEGLYFLTSVTLVVSMMRLAQKSVLLHDMKSIETLARVDVLCVDKTGTITSNDMRVVRVVDLSGGAYAEETPEIGGSGPSQNCIHASADAMQTGTQEAFEHSPVFALIRDFVASMPEGNQTDKALRAFFSGPAGRTADRIQPFSSAYKYSSAGFGSDTYVMGAPEFILHESAGEARMLAERYSAEGFRAMLFARYPGPADGCALTEPAEPLALILIENSIRKNAAGTFRFFAEQDVQIKVISGDNPVTVSRIAKEAGIANADSYVDAGQLVTEEDFDEAVLKYNVFGRVKPDQKLSLVKALKKAGHTVGMTGDGVNDVLALKEADCSVAMASGCDAAVQVSKLVLIDSDFSAMPLAVAEGRRVVNNIQRSASLFLVKNIFSLVTALFSIIFFMQYPFEPSQISLIAAFTIGIPGFFLAMAPSYERIKGSFMKNVLVKALPAGLTDALVVIGISVLGRYFKVDPADISTAATILIALVGFMILFYIVWPPKGWHIALFALCAIGMAAVSLTFGNIFGIGAMSKNCIILFAVFAVISVPLLKILTLLVQRLADRREKKHGK